MSKSNNEQSSKYLDLLIVLAYKPTKVTIGKLFELLQFQEKDAKEQIAQFVYNRLYERYIEPSELLIKLQNEKLQDKLQNEKLPPETIDTIKVVDELKLGFSIMANMCLLIETFQAFRKGWVDTDGKSKQAFLDFFKDYQKKFDDIKGEVFYKNIRCGILHQGETTCSWKLQINEDAQKCADNEKLIIYSRIFLNRMKDVLDQYKQDLEQKDLSSEEWLNCRIKLHAILCNCIRIK